MLMLAVPCLSSRTLPSFFHTTRGGGRPVAVHPSVTLLPSSAFLLGEIHTILDETARKWLSIW